MKKLLLIISLILGFKNLKSQSYIPMVEDSMMVVNKINYFITDRYSYRKYKYIGDTLINSISYFKCYSDTNLKDSSFLITPAMKYYGAIREVNKKVYFLKKDSLIERKIYDFSVNLYDTTNIFYSSNSFYSNYPCYFYRIDNNFSSYFPRKAFYYREVVPVFTINIVAEGYGNIIYHLNGIEVDYPTRRTCNIRKNNSRYNIPANYTACYQDITNSFISIKELNLSKQISLFPNPAKNKITIFSEEVKVATISIVDIQGKVIRKIKVNSIKKDLDVSSLDKGIYLLKIETQKGTVVKKMVKE